MIRDKWFCCAFKLGFLQLICKTSLIFKANLELTLSILLKERELHESKHAVVDLKNIRLVILSDMLLNPSLKMMTSFANIARTAASTNKFMY